MDLRLLLSLVLLGVLIGCAESKKSITCFSCVPKPGQPKWCARDEAEGSYKQCKSDDPLVPANTCYKSVSKSGEVRKGCAPSKWNHDYVYTSDVGLNGEKDVKTYFCNTKLCNSAPSSSSTPFLLVLVLSTFMMMLSR